MSWLLGATKHNIMIGRLTFTHYCTTLYGSFDQNGVLSQSTEKTNSHRPNSVSQNHQMRKWNVQGLTHKNNPPKINIVKYYIQYILYQSQCFISDWKSEQKNMTVKIIIVSSFATWFVLKMLGAISAVLFVCTTPANVFIQIFVFFIVWVPVTCFCILFRMFNSQIVP